MWIVYYLKLGLLALTLLAAAYLVYYRLTPQWREMPITPDLFTAGTGSISVNPATAQYFYTTPDCTGCGRVIVIVQDATLNKNTAGFWVKAPLPVNADSTITSSTNVQNFNPSNGMGDATLALSTDNGIYINSQDKAGAFLEPGVTFGFRFECTISY